MSAWLVSTLFKFLCWFLQFCLYLPVVFIDWLLNMLGYDPGTHAAVTSFFSVIENFVPGAVFVLDMFCHADLVLPIVLIMFIQVYVVFAVRIVLFIYHQFWGSD